MQPSQVHTSSIDSSSISFQSFVKSLQVVIKYETNQLKKVNCGNVLKKFIETKQQSVFKQLDKDNYLRLVQIRRTVKLYRNAFEKITQKQQYKQFKIPISKHLLKWQQRIDPNDYKTSYLRAIAINKKQFNWSNQFIQDWMKALDQQRRVQDQKKKKTEKSKSQLIKTQPLPLPQVAPTQNPSFKSGQPNEQNKNSQPSNTSPKIKQTNPPQKQLQGQNINKDNQSLLTNKMKINHQQPKNNSQHKPNDPKSQILTACNHKIDLLLRRQNCHLPSVLCQHKCSHKHLNNHNSDEHQYSTENQLKKFITNKIQHKNKPVMMEKELFKEQILRQISNAEQALKKIKQNLSRQIDTLYYGAVKSANNQVTGKGMDKFFNSELETLTCHQVYGLFNFKPIIEEKTNYEISSSLKVVKQQVIDLTNYIFKSINSINEQFLTIQIGQQRMIPQQEIQHKQKVLTNQQIHKIKNLNKMDEEVNQSKTLTLNTTINPTHKQSTAVKLNTTLNPLPKQPIQPQKLQQQPIQQTLQSKPIVKTQILQTLQPTQSRKVQSQKTIQINQTVIEHKLARREEASSIKGLKQMINESEQATRTQKQVIKEDRQTTKQVKSIITQIRQPRKQQKQSIQPQKQHKKQIKIIHSQLPKPVQKKQDPSNVILSQTKKSQKIPQNQLSQTNQQKKNHPIMSEDKSLKPNEKTNDKPVLNQKPPILTKQDHFKPSDYFKLNQKNIDNISILQKCKKFETISPQPSKINDSIFKAQQNSNDQSKSIDQTSKTINQPIKPTNDQNKAINEPTRPTNQKQSSQKYKNLPQNKQFQVLLNDYKALGSLDKVFKTNQNKQDVSKICDKPIFKTTSIQGNTFYLHLPLNQKQELHLKKQNKITNQEQTHNQNIFSDLKRPTDSYREKCNNEGHIEGRKIVKIGNQLPVSATKNDSQIIKQPTNNDNQMTPEHQDNKQANQMNKIKDCFQTNSEKQTLISNEKTQSKKIQTKVSQQKPIEKTINQKQQIRPPPVLTGSEKNMFELVQKQGQSKIYQPKQTQMELQLQNQSSVEQKQTPTFKAANFEENVEKLNPDKTNQETQKQSKISEKPPQDKEKQQPNTNTVTEPKKLNQKQQSQISRSFLPSPSNLKVHENSSSAAQRQSIPIQSFESGVKKIRLQQPGSRMFGRATQSPIFNCLELFQKAQQGLRQSQQRRQEKRQEYNKNSLLAQIEKSNPSKSNIFEGAKQNSGNPESLSMSTETMNNTNSTGKDTLNPIGLEQKKNSQKKLNYNGNFYDNKLPSWIPQRK